MSEIYSFSEHRPPVLEIELPDKNKTVVHVTPPTLKLIEEVTERMPDLLDLHTKGAPELVRASFDLAARMMSCNLDGMTFTAEDLRDAYELTRYDVIGFFKLYVDFLTEIKDAKN